MDSAFRLRKQSPFNKKCQSCGDSHSYKYYNMSFLCYMCYYMDARGVIRPKTKAGMGKPNETNPS